jgi:hypothetical protein
LAVHNVSLHEQVGQNQDIFDHIEFIFSSDPQIQRWKEEDKQLAKDTHPLEGSSWDVIHESITAVFTSILIAYNTAKVPLSLLPD